MRLIIATYQVHKLRKKKKKIKRSIKKNTEVDL